MFEFTLDATCGPARAGTLVLPHGTVETPAFMPVGTQGTVRTLSPADLHAVGAELVLANTYHLHVRPGEGVVERLGGLHRFMSWDRPLLTDSRSEEHTSELQSRPHLVCRLLLEKKNTQQASAMPSPITGSPRNKLL